MRLATILVCALVCGISTKADVPSSLDALDAGKAPARLRPGKSAPVETLVELGLRDGRWDTLAFRPDGKALAASEPGGTILVWSLPDLRAVAKLTHREVVALAYSPDGKTLAATDAKGNLRLWTMASPPVPRALLSGIHKDGPIWSLAWSPDGKMMATAGKDMVIKLWDMKPSKPTLKATLAGNEKVVRQAAFAPDGSLLATAGSLGKLVTLWDLAGDRPKVKAELPCDGPAASVSFAPDGKSLASASYDGRVRIWKLDTDDPSAELTIDMGQKAVRLVQFAPDGKSFAVLLPGEAGDRIAFRDRDGGKLLDWTFVHHIQGMSFAPDSRHFATANEDSVYILRLK